jgi:2-polyprenyl-6-methoxyphenol hydroxylase-like FAD-dependent oxidoreductase
LLKPNHDPAQTPGLTLACDLARRGINLRITLLRDELPHQVQAQYVLAADGGRSILRRYLNVGFEGETWKDDRMLVGDVQVEVLDPLPSTNAFQCQAQIPPD